MVRAILRNLVLAATVAAAAATSGALTRPSFADEVVVSGPETSSVRRPVKLGLNKSLVVDLPRDARDVLVSNPAIADAVMRTPRRIYLTGIAVGQANIIVFDRAGAEIAILDLEVERDNANLARLLRRLIPGSNINVEVITDNIILSGSVRTAADSRRAQDIANIFANGGQNAQPPPQTSTASAPGGTGVSVSVTSGGDVPQSSVVNLLSIEGEDQVHLKVTVAEVNRNIAKQLGINLSGAAGGIPGFVSSIVTQNPFGIANGALSNTAVTAGYYNNANNNLTGTLRALNETSMIKTLAEPTLTAISGESASFLAGGEFPVPVGKDEDGNILIEYKPFGVQLAFTPVVLSEGRISLRVKTEVSELSTQDAVTLSGISVPSIVVRKSETTMELPSGGSMVMAGLIQDNVKQAISAFPGLGRLPILGTLFRSRDFERKETELVIIVTPYLVKPVARDQLALPTDGFAPASDANGNFLGRINRVYGIEGKPAPAGSYRGTYGFILE